MTCDSPTVTWLSKPPPCCQVWPGLFHRQPSHLLSANWIFWVSTFFQKIEQACRRVLLMIALGSAEIFDILPRWWWWCGWGGGSRCPGTPPLPWDGEPIKFWLETGAAGWGGLGWGVPRPINRTEGGRLRRLFIEAQNILYAQIIQEQPTHGFDQECPQSVTITWEIGHFGTSVCSGIW